MPVSFLIFIFFVPFLSCEIVGPSILPNNTANMALVVYEPPKIFEVFQAENREFSFVGHVLNISQDWEKNGVAAVVWDAALVLSRYLENSVAVAGKKVIELGAGTGLVGLVAGLLGAHVTITDRKMALKLAEENAQRNTEKLNTSVKVKELEWGQAVSGLNPPFDYILGADIVYIEETFDQLLRTIHELSDQKTVVLLSCKIRYEREQNFLQLLSETFQVDEVLYDQKADIYVYKAMKKLL